MMLLHRRIIKYLIENCGFTIVATETGLPESRLIFDYVQNQPVSDVEAMYKKGLNKMYAEWQEGRDWMDETLQSNSQCIIRFLSNKFVVYVYL